MRTWTDAARTAQAEAIRRWQPWNKSTGPTSAAGKAACARNACKGKFTLHRLMTQLLSRQNAYRLAVVEAAKARLEATRQKKINPKQTIMEVALRLEGDAIILGLIELNRRLEDDLGWPGGGENDVGQALAA